MEIDSGAHYVRLHVVDCYVAGTGAPRSVEQYPPHVLGSFLLGKWSKTTLWTLYSLVIFTGREMIGEIPHKETLFNKNFASSDIAGLFARAGLSVGGFRVRPLKSNSCAWVGSGFRSYVDFEFNGSRQISRLLIALEDSSSEDEGPNPKTKVARTQRSAEVPSAIADPPESDSPPSETPATTQSVYGFHPDGFSGPFPKFKCESEINFSV